MRWLMRAIGRVLGITPTATPVCQTQDGQTGGNSSTVKVRKSVNKESKPKRKAVKQVTQAPSPTTETLCAPTRTKKSSTPGTPLATPAPQPVKSKPKAKRSPAQRTTQAVLPKRGQKAAQAESGATGKQRKTPASKTHQRAK